VPTRHPLTVTRHDRDVVGMTYVYPVLSRRAGGVSVGVNLNPNQACNWHCVYCQVPNLVRGSGPEIELDRLEGELAELLDAILGGDLGIARAALRDVAFSGNGEPTTSPDFPAAVEVVAGLLASRGLAGSLPIVLITNGSTFHRPPVARALERIAKLGGEIWFKLDSATPAGTARVNGVRLPMTERLAQLRRAAARAPTWLQTCVFAWDGAPPSADEQAAYLGLIAELVAEKVPLRGVLLYGLARPSAQPEASRIASLPPEWLEDFGRRIGETGLLVRVSP
jgi:wyosine [tRNA(Phe)-imidazoG37] synthetase (radical SAM superfamily)